MSRVSPTFISEIRSLPHAVTATMPSNVTPRPKCANAVPQAERGNPMARCNAARKGTRKICVRSATSVIAPAMTKTATPAPNGARTGPPCSSANRGDSKSGQYRRRQQSLRHAQQIAALPAEQRPKWYDNHQRDEQRNERRIEERRAYGNLWPDEHLERERIKRSNEHGGACRSQKEIVEHQCTFARNRRE